MRESRLGRLSLFCAPISARVRLWAYGLRSCCITRHHVLSRNHKKWKPVVKVFSLLRFGPLFRILSLQSIRKWIKIFFDKVNKAKQKNFGGKKVKAERESSFLNFRGLTCFSSFLFTCCCHCSNCCCCYCWCHCSCHCWWCCCNYGCRHHICCCSSFCLGVTVALQLLDCSYCYCTPCHPCCWCDYCCHHMLL